jgi:hypothetical protein
MRNLLILVLVLFKLIPVCSQSTLGFGAGPQYPLIPYTTHYDHADLKPEFSWLAGTNFSSPLYRHFSYSVSLFYNRLGAHILGSESSHSNHTIEDINLTLGFLSLNAMPQYSFGKSNFFYVKAGAYFSVLVNSKEVGSFETDVINGDHQQGEIDRDAKNDYEDIDYGLAFNTGVRLKFDDVSWFVVQLGYNLGLYKYNQVGSNMQNIHKSGFKSAYFLLGFDINLSRHNAVP